MGPYDLSFCANDTPRLVPKNAEGSGGTRWVETRLAGAGCRAAPAPAAPSRRPAPRPRRPCPHFRALAETRVLPLLVKHTPVLDSGSRCRECKSFSLRTQPLAPPLTHRHAAAAVCLGGRACGQQQLVRAANPDPLTALHKAAACGSHNWSENMQRSHVSKKTATLLPRRSAAAGPCAVADFATAANALTSQAAVPAHRPPQPPATVTGNL